MRKLSARRRRWLKRASLRGVRTSRNRKYFPRLKTKSAIPRIEAAVHKNERRVGVLRGGQFEWATLNGTTRPVPTILCLKRNWRETVQFLNDVRKGLSAVFAQGHINKEFRNRHKRRSSPLRVSGHWDFSTIREMSSSVALILASEYDRIRQLRGWVPVAIEMEKWDHDILEMLFDVGFLDMVQITQNRDKTTQTMNGRLLKLCCGMLADGSAIAENLSELGIDWTNEQPGLWEAIVEAVTNCVNHAYRHDELCMPNGISAWWMTASIHIDKNDRRLSIAVYDQGATIPGTLHKWENYPMLVRVLSGFFSFIGLSPSRIEQKYDAMAINTAIQIGKTSTERAFRGKGLDQIVRALDFCKSGSVAIYSRCGHVEFKKSAPVQIVNHSSAMVGTLVTWDLVL